MVWKPTAMAFCAPAAALVPCATASSMAALAR